MEVKNTQYLHYNTMTVTVYSIIQYFFHNFFIVQKDKWIYFVLLCFELFLKCVQAKSHKKSKTLGKL